MSGDGGVDDAVEFGETGLFGLEGILDIAEGGVGDDVDGGGAGGDGGVVDVEVGFFYGLFDESFDGLRVEFGGDECACHVDMAAAVGIVGDGVGDAYGTEYPEDEDSTEGECAEGFIQVDFEGDREVDNEDEAG